MMSWRMVKYCFMQTINHNMFYGTTVWGEHPMVKYVYTYHFHRLNIKEYNFTNRCKNVYGFKYKFKFNIFFLLSIFFTQQYTSNTFTFILIHDTMSTVELVKSRINIL